MWKGLLYCSGTFDLHLWCLGDGIGGGELRVRLLLTAYQAWLW